VQAMKVKPIRFAENNLYRHKDFALPPSEEQSNIKREQHQTPVRPNQALRTRTEHLGESMSADFDDEFDGTLFDGVEITEHTDDAFTIESTSGSHATGTKAVEAAKLVHGAGEVPANHAKPAPNGARNQPNNTRQSTPVTNGPGGVPQQRSSNAGPPRPPPNGSNQRGPQTPVQQQNSSRPEQGRSGAPPIPDTHKTSVQQPQNGQPSKLTPPQTQQQPPHQSNLGPQVAGTAIPPTNASGTGNRPSVGFVTSRAAELLQNSDATAPPNNIPAFNPHAESPLPKEQRTPGLDHTRSVPTKRHENGVGAALPAQGATRAAPVTGGAGFGRPQETSRRLGMPGAAPYAMSPSANRGAYKPPTFANGAGPPNALKRDRVALQDVSNANPSGNTAEGHELKRQRIETPDAENARVGA
jgi:recombination DNA repair RAD52 pathway protein